MKKNSNRVTNPDDVHTMEESILWYPAILTYVQYAILIIFGHIREFGARVFGHSRYLKAPLRKGYAELLVSWENFYTKRIYHRIQDTFNRPVVSSPGATIDVCKRISTDGNKTLHVLPGEINHCINLGSYNYLGFADDWMNTCSESVFQALEDFPVASSSPAMEFGTTALHVKLERVVADFVGKPDAIVFGMGYLTNATVIPTLMGKGSLIISDSLNHASIVNGSRSSTATIRVFRHNSPAHLENVLRHAISYGQPRTHRPWKKIMVVIEGIYSMEGEIVSLKEIVAVVKKYRAFLYLDEAHSIGALGRTGRGVCEYHNIDPKDVDIMMGTFTKSFGAMGGYIAASRDIISFLRSSCGGSMYATSMSPVIVQQVLRAFEVIKGEDGTTKGLQKLDALRENSNYFRNRLAKTGCIVFGDNDSPVIPVLLYSPSKIAFFSRECLRRNLAVVIVGFPATPLLLARVRFCVSASHTREQLDKALSDLEEVLGLLRVRYKFWLTG